LTRKKGYTQPLQMSPRFQHIIEDGVEKKRCCKCQTFRSLDKYNNCTKTWDKLRPECKPCLSERRVANKEKMTEYNKVYWQKTKETQTAKNKEWREKNKDRVKENMKEWLEKNKERKREMDKKYREEHWEEKRAYNKEWNRKNYQDMKTNPDRKEEFRLLNLKKNCARRIREMLKQKKASRTMKYVGCTFEYLKTHLEAQFEEGMTWENYGNHKFGKDKDGWHIDHIIPCKAFNLDDPVEQKACFYYMNLQPLWGEENIVKKDEFDQADKDAYLEFYKSTVDTASETIADHEEYDSDLDSNLDSEDESEEDLDALRTENEALKARLAEMEKQLGATSVIQHI
jgi:hypothetical protein